MELGEVLSKAWKIIWKNKILWIFGILSSCGRGGGGGGGGGGGNSGSDFNMPNNGDFNFENGENPFSNGQFPGMEEFGRNLEQMFGNGDQVPWGIVIGLICLIFFISLVFLFIQSIGRAGMIRGTVLADAGQDSLSFGQVWAAGSPYFVKIFLLNLLIGMAFLIATLILLVPLAFFGIVTMGIGLICILPLLCLMVPIGWAVNVVIEQANVALVVENLGYIEAIKRAWKICRENLGPVAVTGLVILVGGWIVGFIIALPVLLMFIPLVIGAASQDETIMTTGAVTFGVLLCCLVPVIIALGGVLQSYKDSAWTLTFLRLTAQKPDQNEIQHSPPMTE